MPRFIAILEDNLDRQTAMKRWLDARFPSYQSIWFDEAEPMIAWLQEHLADTLFASLDHDLDLKPTDDGRWYDPGTGRMVADYLVTCQPNCPIIIHSTNREAVVGMEMILQERGWNIAIVQPYGDLAWINEAWWPTVKHCAMVAEDKLER
jgi:hypothetical protein